jgi:hypothetical protein
VLKKLEEEKSEVDASKSFQKISSKEILTRRPIDDNKNPNQLSSIKINVEENENLDD